MKATDILKNEHRAIERVLDSLDRASDAILAGKEVRPQTIADGIDFVRNFADKCHHGKEEGRIFPLFSERGLGMQGGPIQVMLIEHEQGRAHIREALHQYGLWTQGDVSAGPAMAKAIQGYTGLLREHIYKEDNILYPMGDRVITEEDDERLVEEFDEVEETEMGPGVHEKYHALIDELEEKTKSAAQRNR